MSSTTVIAFILVAITLIELVLWLIEPEWLLSVSDVLYGYPRVAQVMYLILGGVILGFLLQHFTMVEIMAVVAFSATIMGLGLAPFGAELTEITRRKMKRGTFWTEFGAVWVVWGILVVWTLYALLN